MNPLTLRHLSYGVYTVTTYDRKNSRLTGCIANSIMQVTSSPATLALSINHDNYTNGCIKEHGILAVSILSERTDGQVLSLGFTSGRDADKFASLPYDLVQDLPVPKGCMAYLICKVMDRMEASTHTVFLAEILDAQVLLDEPPMTYAYYHQVRKGVAPKNAPTYLPEPAQEKKAVWKCSVCGYLYEGEPPFEELGEDYVCPVCGAPKSKFTPQ